MIIRIIYKIKQTHLIGALKEKIKYFESEIDAKNNEISNLKRNIKVTKLKEYEVYIVIKLNNIDSNTCL